MRKIVAFDLEVRSVRAEPDQDVLRIPVTPALDANDVAVRSAAGALRQISETIHAPQQSVLLQSNARGNESKARCDGSSVSESISIASSAPVSCL